MFLLAMKIYGWQWLILRLIGQPWSKFVVCEPGVTMNIVARAASARNLNSLKRWATGL